MRERLSDGPADGWRGGPGRGFDGPPPRGDFERRGGEGRRRGIGATVRRARRRAMVRRGRAKVGQKTRSNERLI